MVEPPASLLYPPCHQQHRDTFGCTKSFKTHYRAHSGCGDAMDKMATHFCHTCYKRNLILDGVWQSIQPPLLSPVMFAKEIEWQSP
eukprot:4355591-Ditylum_brightwellii.AAC.1